MIEEKCWDLIHIAEQNIRNNAKNRASKFSGSFQSLQRCIH